MCNFLFDHKLCRHCLCGHSVFLVLSRGTCIHVLFENYKLIHIFIAQTYHQAITIKISSVFFSRIFLAFTSNFDKNSENNGFSFCTEREFLFVLLCAGFQDFWEQADARIDILITVSPIFHVVLVQRGHNSDTVALIRSLEGGDGDYQVHHGYVPNLNKRRTARRQCLLFDVIRGTL